MPLETPENIVFADGIFFRTARTMRRKMRRSLDPKEHLAQVKKFLSKIRPMKAAFDQNYVKTFWHATVKKGRTKYDLAVQIRDDIRKFQRK